MAMAPVDQDPMLVFAYGGFRNALQLQSRDRNSRYHMRKIGDAAIDAAVVMDGVRDIYSVALRDDNIVLRENTEHSTLPKVQGTLYLLQSESIKLALRDESSIMRGWELASIPRHRIHPKNEKERIALAPKESYFSLVHELSCDFSGDIEKAAAYYAKTLQTDKEIMERVIKASMKVPPEIHHGREVRGWPKIFRLNKEKTFVVGQPWGRSIMYDWNNYAEQNVENLMIVQRGVHVIQAPPTVIAKAYQGLGKDRKSEEFSVFVKDKHGRRWVSADEVRRQLD